MNVQFKKGVLELCVMLILDESECYGYELITRISESIEISEGTIYPLLKRLKDEGFVTTYLEESQQGPPRKYYKITTIGKKEKEQLLFEWEKIVKGVEVLNKGGESK
jgi:PadR family transcriptional regulator PadR